MGSDDGFFLLMAAMIVLSVGRLFIFGVNKNTAMKKRLWPLFSIATGALFIAILYLFGFPAEVQMIAVPVILLVTLFNLRAFRFCDCGRTAMRLNIFAAPPRCSACGKQIA